MSQHLTLRLGRAAKGDARQFSISDSQRAFIKHSYRRRKQRVEEQSNWTPRATPLDPEPPVGAGRILSIEPQLRPFSSGVTFIVEEPPAQQIIGTVKNRRRDENADR